MTPMDDVARELGQLFRSLKGLHHAVLVDVGVRVEMPAAAILSTLADRGTLRPSALAELLHLDLSSVSRQVAALEREGWVGRERDPADSRAALLDLTPAGLDVLARVRAGRVAQLQALLPDWSDSDLAAFADSLHRFRTDLTAAAASTAVTTSPSATAATSATAITSPSDRIPALAGQESP